MQHQKELAGSMTPPCGIEAAAPLIERIVAQLEGCAAISEFAVRRLVGNLGRLTMYRDIDQRYGRYVDAEHFAVTSQGALRIRFNGAVENLPKDVDRELILRVMVIGAEAELAERVWKARLNVTPGVASERSGDPLRLLRELQGSIGGNQRSRWE